MSTAISFPVAADWLRSVRTGYPGRRCRAVLARLDPRQGVSHQLQLVSALSSGLFRLIRAPRGGGGTAALARTGNGGFTGVLVPVRFAKFR
jgi:hypothetical protein